VANIGDGKKIIYVNFRVQVNKQFTDLDLRTQFYPITLTDADTDSPLGCTPGQTSGTCNNISMVGTFPKITSALVDMAYAQVYRYAEWVHSFGGPSGEAELGGNDMILGMAEFEIAFNGHPGGSRHQQAGTFAHELLHLLNGMHGGPQYLIYDTFREPLEDSEENCKPYPGVDKYSGQFPNTYLTAVYSTPGDVFSDIDPSSPWKLTYSDGTHGINPAEDDDFDFGPEGPAHVDVLQALGGEIGGLDEANLVEDLSSGLPGTPYTMTFATPDSTHGDASHNHLSDSSGPIASGSELATDSNRVLSVGDIDWDDSQTITAGTVSADINNYGFPGCITNAGDDPDPIFYDYDAFYHMDFNFREGLSVKNGQFDGASNFQVENSGDQINLAKLNFADYDGIEEVGLTEFLEEGTGMAKDFQLRLNYWVMYLMRMVIKLQLQAAKRLPKCL